MPASSYWGATKPPPGVGLDQGHPLAAGLVFCASFNEGAGLPFDIARGVAGTPLGTVRWKGSPQGVAGYVPAGGGNTNAWSWSDATFLPTGRATVLFIRRKTDTTLRAAVALGVGNNTPSNSAILRAYVPYSDGVVYWDFGEQGGANRLSVSGLSFPVAVEHWAFIAGSRGLAIYRDGVRLASSGTAVTRVATTSSWRLGASEGALASDDAEYIFCAVLDAEWSAEQVRAWAAQPYCMFAAPAWRRYFAASAAKSLLPFQQRWRYLDRKRVA